MTPTDRCRVPTKRILLLARDRAQLDGLPARLGGTPPPVETHATRRMGEALSLLSRETFDAAVCSVESPGDVLSVIRFKKASPRTPVLALASKADSELSVLTLQMGAAAVLRQETTPSDTAEAIRRALAMDGLAHQMRDRAGSYLESAREICKLSARTQMMAADSLAQIIKHPAEGFEPLLVENDVDEAFFFLRALRKAGLPRQIPIARTAQEAIDYLAGRGEFGNRPRHPVPSIVILDLHLGLDTGEAVLRFIRTRPALEHLPVILLSSSQNPAEVARMIELGVSAHIIKPQSHDQLFEAVRLILNFWQVWRTQNIQARGPSGRPCRCEDDRPPQ